MNRRTFLRATASVVAIAPLAKMVGAPNDSQVHRSEHVAKLTPPASGGIPVAVLISEQLNVIDFSGPWGVFESVQVPGATEPSFHLFTVAETSEIVTSGSGLKLKPDFTFANAPETKVIVIPASKARTR